MTNVCFTGKDDFMDCTRAECERAATDVLGWQPVTRVARSATGPGNVLVHRAHPRLTGKLRAAQVNGWRLLTYDNFYERIRQENDNRTAIDASQPRGRIFRAGRDGGRMAPIQIEHTGGPTIADMMRAQRRDSDERSQKRKDKTEDVFDDTTRDLDI